MKKKKHWAVFISNATHRKILLQQLTEKEKHPIFSDLNGLTGTLFSAITLNEFIDEEERHDHFEIKKNSNQHLKSMSTGEQKKVLLAHLLQTKPDYLILDNPFDHLDIDSQAALSNTLTEISHHTSIVLLVSRHKDLLPFITDIVSVEHDKFVDHKGIDTFLRNGIHTNSHAFVGNIPPPLSHYTYEEAVLIKCTNVSVSYEDKAVLKNINWEIRPGDFWQLVGKNGTGKTTLLSLITGDNTKGYGQDLTIFGHKKGTGESVWDLKSKIGYFTPTLTREFPRRHTALQMILSGFFDSVGLYTKPSDIQLKLAGEWLQLLNLWEIKNVAFTDLSLGQQRMVMIARAMIKHPLLLILDEPATGLDDESTEVLVMLINKIAQESRTTILYVSHTEEEGLTPQHIYQLTPTPEGSKGKVIG